MKRFECVVPGSGIRTFGRAVHCLAKIGEEIFFEASQDLLSLKTVNGARSAYACILFKRSFFHRYTAGATKSPQQTDEEESSSNQLSIKLTLKSFVSVFRSPTSLERTVDHCMLSLDSTACKLVFIFHCKHGIVKTHQLGFQECDNLQAVYTKELCPNQITGAGRSLGEVVGNFPTGLEEVTITALPDKLRLRNYAEEMDDYRSSITEVFLHPQEFEDYQVGVDTSITFCLKELRAILGFTDALNLPLSVRFETAGKPVVFSIDKEANESCTADFVLATLTESLTQTHATSSNGAAGPTAARATPSGVSLSTSITVAADVDSDLTASSKTDRHARPHDSSHLTTARVSRGDSFAGPSSTSSRAHTIPDKRQRRKTSVGDSGMRKGQKEAGDPSAPGDLMEGLFDVENADEVVELDPGRERGREDTSLSDNQLFADFPHQGKFISRSQQQSIGSNKVTSMVAVQSHTADPEECVTQSSVVDSPGFLPSTPPAKKYKSVFAGIDMFAGSDDMTILAPDSESEED